MRIRDAGIWLGILLGAGLFGCVPCSAAEQEDPAVTLIQRAERELLRYRVQIKNASVRLEQGLQGMGTGAPDPNAPATPANLCCAVNLKKMRGAYVTLTKVFDELGGCYAAAEGSGNISQLEFAKAELNELARVVEEFALAPDDDAAAVSLQRLTIAYLRLLETMDRFEPCPAESESAAPATGSSGGKAGQKSKTKEPAGDASGN